MSQDAKIIDVRVKIARVRIAAARAAIRHRTLMPVTDPEQARRIAAFALMKESAAIGVLHQDVLDRGLAAVERPEQLDQFKWRVEATTKVRREIGKLLARVRAKVVPSRPEERLQHAAQLEMPAVVERGLGAVQTPEQIPGFQWTGAAGMLAREQVRKLVKRVHKALKE